MIYFLLTSASESRKQQTKRKKFFPSIFRGVEFLVDVTVFQLILKTFSRHHWCKKRGTDAGENDMFEIIDQ